MKKRHLKKWFKKQIKSVVELIGVDVQIVCDRNVGSIFEHTLYYQKISHTVSRIGFDDRLFCKHYNKNIKSLSISLKESLIVGVLHEIGHHKDSIYERKTKERKKIQEKILAILNGKVKIKRKDGTQHVQDRFDRMLPYKIQREQITMEIERNAWGIAYKLNQQYHLVPDEAFSIIQEMSLATYEKGLEETINKYNQLENKEELLNMIKL